MTAPFVTTVTKPPSPVAGRPRLQRLLLTLALLLPLLLAIVMLAWMAVPRDSGSGGARGSSWVERMFGRGGQKTTDGGSRQEEVCSLPKETGPCRGALPRYFYSTETGMCEPFLYGGCHGNDNNFETMEECRGLCGGQPADGGEQKISQRVDCSLPRDIGPCRGAMPRYFYSTATGTCEQFLYGGCEGNSNNFETAEECDTHCGAATDSASQHKTSRRVDCSLPKVVGPCRGAKPRYFYSTASGTCEQFLYGGCDGNVNNFETAEECDTHCGAAAADGDDKHKSHEDSAAICSLPMQAGDCRGIIPRYFFNTEASKCSEFNYSGCGGNGNNFETLHDCENMCAANKDASAVSSGADCTSEADGGVCMAYMERYAFNPKTGVCEKFVYGGCGGNGNRYSSVSECEQHCAGGSGGSVSGSNGGEGEPQPLPLPEGGDEKDGAAPKHDTRLCGVSECPMDCGIVGRDGDCVLCSCSPSPFEVPESPALEPIPFAA